MESRRLKPREQGDRGERSAIAWLLGNGHPVFLPVGHSRDIDMITDYGHGPVRIQCKTSIAWRKRRWDVSVCTRGGNRSWNGMVKRLDPNLYDELFVLVGDGRRWLIPSAVVDGGCGIRLGGPKYASYEIEPDRPLHEPAVAVHSAPAGRDSRAVKGVRL